MCGGGAVTIYVVYGFVCVYVKMAECGKVHTVLYVSVCTEQPFCIGD